MSTRLTLGSCTVDLWTGNLSTGGHLRLLELRLLRVLAENRGRAVPPAKLLVEAFDYAAGSRSRTLYTTVHRLRSAVEPDPASPRFILALRGGGYRLSEDAVVRSEQGEEGRAEPQVDAFVGRAELVARVREVGDQPLVTLLGPGGSGKSRVASQVAASTGWWVSLCGVEAGAVVSAVARSGSLPPCDLDELLRRVRERGPCRIVLDDADDVLDEVRTLVDGIRRRAPEARVLVTSREPLSIAGERRLEVGPLEPDEAIELLGLRAAEVRPGAVPLALAAEIVDLVDRLPLAIELAAGRLASFGPEALRDQLARRPEVRSTRSDRPARHRSIGAVIEGTWVRLLGWEREAMCRLSVLEGAFGLGPAEAVLGDPVGPDGIDAASVVTNLQLRGLLAATPNRKAKPFSHLRTVLAFVRERTEPALREEALDRIAAYTRVRAEESFCREQYVLPRIGGVFPFDGGQDPVGLERALRRDLAHEEGPIAVALGQVLDQQTRYPEMERVAERALGRPADPDSRGALRLQRARARYIQAAPEGIAQYREVLGDDTLPVWSRVKAGEIAVTGLLARGRTAEAAEVVDLLDRRVDPVDLPVHRPALDATRARLAEGRGQIERAIDGFQVAERGYHALGAARPARLMRVHVGEALLQAQRLTEGIRTLAAAARGYDDHEWSEVGFTGGYVHGVLGDALLAVDPEAAERHLLRAQQILRNTPGLGWAVETEGCLAERELLRGDLGRAEELVGDAVRRMGSHVAACYRLNVRRVEVLVSIAAGRIAEAEVIAGAALDEAEAMNRTISILRTIGAWTEAMVAGDRLDEARDRLERRLAALPHGTVPPAATVLLLAELRRWTGDLGGAGWAAGVVAARYPERGDRSRAAGLLAALMVEQGEARCGLADARAVGRTAPDPHRIRAAWMAVYGARIARAQGQPVGDPPSVPIGSAVLRRAVAEVFFGG